VIELRRPPESRPRTAPGFLSGRREWLLVALILALGLFLRLHDYTQAPKLADNQDELAWTWAGLSLLEDHSPTSWSYLLAYPHVFAIPEPDNGQLLPGVHPWLDHPPLFALFMGGYAWLAGERHFQDVSDAVIRLPVIALSLLTLLLGYVFGRRLLGPAPAIVGAALFALTPAAVLSSREVESEAVLAPLLLLALLILHRLLRSETRRFEPLLLLLICALAPLFKVPGASFGVIVAVVLAMHGRWRLAGLALTMSCIGLLVYAWYGVLIDWRRFLAVIEFQASRHSGLLSGYEFITAPAFTDRIPLHDGWWLLGWLAVAAVAYQRRGRRADLLLAWPVVSYAGALMLLADPSATHRFGWYRLAVYPLVYLAAADLVITAVSRPTLVPVALLLLLPGATATLGGAPNGASWNPPFLLTFALLAVLVGACIATGRAAPEEEGWKRRRAQLAVGATVALILALNVVQSFRLADIYQSL
jgi:4-amino-4-deoxy-L-arabinose transferase-like glycosyltransferase